ncbi:unnamed protein product [Chilo suppressalis]|uniref:Reverse transcriptase domain-containing protein n=1 Tax=Chilo suppressalis TaxID=168631 RepID=A0ABN8B1N0_CHISP|nr:unnamed protein product [Chilo suppressalis]
MDDLQSASVSYVRLKPRAPSGWRREAYLPVSIDGDASTLRISNTTSKDNVDSSTSIMKLTENKQRIVPHQAVLSLYGSGYSTGISVDLGYDTTDVCPVYEGGIIRYAHMQTNYAGAQITDFFKESLAQKHYHDFGIHTSDILEGMKKNMYVTQNVSMSGKDCRRIYTLPDGEEVDVGEEAFMAAEMIFQPDEVKGFKTNVLPLQEAIVTASLKCDTDLRPELYDAVVLCGGLSMIPGLNTRVATEIENIIQRPINVIMSPEAYAVAWLGGATFAAESPVLTYLYQLSYSLGRVPETRRDANMQPVPKEGDRSDPANSRPIAFTSVLCKVLGRVLNNDLTCYFEDYCLIHDRQYGFRPNRSTGDLLTSGESIAKALDRVWHKSLFSKFPDGSAKYLLDAVDRLQRRAARIIGDEDVTKKLKSLELRRDMASLSTLYRLYHGESPEELFSLIPPSTFLKSTMRAGLLCHRLTEATIPTRTKKFVDSFFCRNIRKWNSLPAHVFPPS